MKQVLMRNGQALVEEIPAPQVEPGTILVRLSHSCISIGTEMGELKSSGMPLWKRALKQPEKVKKALNLVATQGFIRTRRLIESKVSAALPTGYSAAGIVIEVGEGVVDFRIGDRVACAGAQCSHHAEIIRVPRNLVVSVPDNLGFAEASTVTLGSIALQGLRRAQPTLGETFVVIGLGILGQIIVQALKANGCRVIGIDLDRERIDLARKLGMDSGIHPDDENDNDHVWRLTNGIGSDGVIITASTPSDTVISSAFNMCRKKGRVVLVGDVGLKLNRWEFYYKELDLFISTSYGPGRYDHTYEEKGLDYPIGYVRWTENRNMAEYLRLLAEDRISVASLIAATYSIEEATLAYEKLKSGPSTSPMVLLSYPLCGDNSVPNKVVTNSTVRGSGSNQIRIALVGAGDFAKTMHLPSIKSLSDYYLQAVVSRSGPNAVATSDQFGAKYATTDYLQVLSDSEVDAVFITTRHNLHAPMVLEALRAGKHVLVEKPLALTRKELEEIKGFYLQNDSQFTPILLTGFNRRFSRYARRINEITQRRSNPMIINYRMNAGYYPLEHWVHTEEGGGRNLGEACHIYDLFTYLTGSKMLTVDARTINPATGYYSHRDNFIATITFEDGSIANLIYTALGSYDYPKEQMEIFVDGKVIVMDDYKRLYIYGSKLKGIEGKFSDKGHNEEIEAFAYTIRQGGGWPIPLWQQVQATEIAILVDELLGVHVRCAV